MGRRKDETPKEGCHARGSWEIHERKCEFSRKMVTKLTG